MNAMNLQSLFTPEQELLLCCARTRFSDLYTNRVKRLAERGLKWKMIVDLSETHKLTQLLFQNLQTTCPEVVPAEVLSQLQNLYNAQVQYILYQTGELVSLVKEFSAQGIRALPYKGPVLATQVYANLALRPYIDLDILVQPADIPRAKALLLERGYRITWPEIPLNAALEEVHLRTKYNYSLSHPEKKIILELHWGVTPNYFSFPPSIDWLWQDLETVTLAGAELFAFPIEKLLLILCVHGGNHLWDRLGWICDVSELILHYPGLDWDSVFKDAASFGVQRLLLTGLSLAHNLLDAALPGEVRKTVEADARVRWLAQNMIRRFASFQWSGSGFLDIPIYHLRARERFRDKANYCLQMTTPSLKDLTFVSLPAGLSFLYYLIRPVRLAVEYGVNPLLKR
jgi:Uncharacterised nucleotidyltransferase